MLGYLCGRRATRGRTSGFRRDPFPGSRSPAPALVDLPSRTRATCGRTPRRRGGLFALVSATFSLRGDREESDVPARARARRSIERHDRPPPNPGRSLGDGLHRRRRETRRIARTKVILARHCSAACVFRRLAPSGQIDGVLRWDDLNLSEAAGRRWRPVRERPAAATARRNATPPARCRTTWFSQFRFGARLVASAQRRNACCLAQNNESINWSWSPWTRDRGARRQNSAPRDASHRSRRPSPTRRIFARERRQSGRLRVIPQCARPGPRRKAFHRSRVNDARARQRLARARAASTLFFGARARVVVVVAAADAGSAGESVAGAQVRFPRRCRCGKRGRKNGER